VNAQGPEQGVYTTHPYPAGHAEDGGRAATLDVLESKSRRITVRVERIGIRESVAAKGRAVPISGELDSVPA
jgi:hypothetical protein